MGLFRNAVNLFRGRARNDREEVAAELLTGQAIKDREEVAAEVLTGQAEVVTAQPVVADREVKREVRPDPNKPGWGRTIGQEIGKARGDRASQQ